MQHSGQRAWRLLGALLALIPMAVSAPAAAAAPHTTQSDDRGTVSWLVQPAGPLGGADVRTYLEHELQPGASADDAIAITNHGESELTVRVFATDAFSDPRSGGFSLLPSGEAPRDAGAWVHLAASEVTIPARATAEVPVVISVPADAEPGDHAGGLVTAYTSDAVDQDGQPVLLESRIAMRLYLQVAGERRPSLAVEDAWSTFTPGAHQVTGTLRVAYTVRNTGNTRLGADEDLRAQGPFGVGLRSPALSTVAELLPGDRVRREVVVEDVPAALALTTRIAVTPVDLRTGTELAPVVVTTGTSAVPWLALLALVLLGTSTGWVVRRRRRRWRALRAQLAAAGGATTPPS